MTNGGHRRPLVAGNWKMHLGPSEATEFLATIVEPLEALGAVERVVCPPAISLPAAHAALATSEIALCAQNMYFEERGAFTGEISPEMVRALCTHVLLGHSERRTLFGETDALVQRKVLAAFAHDLTPIVCVGERLEERDAGQTERVLTAQVHGSLADLPAERVPDLVVAYEPVWAIGTGRAATATDATDAAALLRALLGRMYGVEAAQAVRVLYGGSVTAANVTTFAREAEIDGALVGGASITPSFVEIVRATAEAKGLL